MDFTRINQVGLLDSVRPVKRLSELELDKEYSITGMRIAETKWGTRVVVDVDNTFTCFLPTRFVKAFEDEDGLFQQMSEAAANKKLIMQYYGTQFNKLEFRPAKELS